MTVISPPLWIYSTLLREGGSRNLLLALVAAVRCPAPRRRCWSVVYRSSLVHGQVEGWVTMAIPALPAACCSHTSPDLWLAIVFHTADAARGTGLRRASWIRPQPKQRALPYHFRITANKVTNRPSLATGRYTPCGRTPQASGGSAAPQRTSGALIVQTAALNAAPHICDLLHVLSHRRALCPTRASASWAAGWLCPARTFPSWAAGGGQVGAGSPVRPPWGPPWRGGRGRRSSLGASAGTPIGDRAARGRALGGGSWARLLLRC